MEKGKKKQRQLVHDIVHLLQLYLVLTEVPNGHYKMKTATA